MSREGASVSTRKISPNSLANLRPPWKPGECPNPGGKPKIKPLTEALQAELTPENCKRIAKKMVAKALQASVPHFSEIANRVEGKVGADESDNNKGGVTIIFDMPMPTNLKPATVDADEKQPA
jgi:hypothetical protein